MVFWWTTTLDCHDIEKTAILKYCNIIAVIFKIQYFSKKNYCRKNSHRDRPRTSIDACYVAIFLSTGTVIFIHGFSIPVYPEPNPQLDCNFSNSTLLFWSNVLFSLPFSFDKASTCIEKLSSSLPLLAYIGHVQPS